MISIKRYPLFDGHNDSLVRTYMTRKSENPRSLLKRSESGHLDIPRSREAGLFGGMFAIFVPEDPECFDPPDTGLETTEHGYRFPLAEAIDAAYAREFTTAVLDYLDRIVVESDGQLTIARSIADLTDNRRENSLHMVIHLEGAEAVDPDLKLLPQYYDRGVRSLGMVWSRPNAFGWGVPFEFPRTPDTGPGLTDAGRHLVGACNELGIVIDLAHLNEKGFWEVAKLSSAPLVDTHAAAHALTATTRNLTDKQLDAIGESGGVVGVNFCVGDIRREVDGWNDANTPIEALVRHMAYIADRIGIDHVAFGSDFDGATIPNEMGDVTGLPLLVEALHRHGFNHDALNKITHQNWLRVLAQTWK